MANIEGAERELDWFLDGDPEFERYCDERLDSVGLALYGRRAYELMLSYRITRARNYFFNADVLAEVCSEFGVPYRVNGHRYWPEAGAGAATPPKGAELS